MPPRADHQHPPTVTAAADGSHTKGGMIALMPAAEDAERLAIPGGEPAEELHCTLFFLGDDGAAWTEDQRDELEERVRGLVAGLPVVRARAFGAAHWNGGGDYPCWVWSVGDDRDAELPSGSLGEARVLAGTALTMTMDLPEIPEQHSPWAAHVCAAYSDDPALLPELEQRLGPVTFDRIRLSFGDDDRDIPLTGDAVTAAAGPLRREPTELELASRADFASVHAEWEAATAGAMKALRSTTAAWRLDLRQQITRDLADGDLDTVLGLTLDRQAAAATLLDLMDEYAVKAGRACQREAEAQGVRVPDWSLTDDEDDAVTAALAGRRLLASIAELASDLMSGALLTAAKRKLSGLLRSNRPSEQIAAEVDRELSTVDDTSVRAAVANAMTAAQNAGRHAVMDAAPPASSYVASEILDRRTCGPCKTIDGRTFTTLDSAMAEYPVMGYRDCTGARYGNACRGFLVAVWQEVRSPATTASSGSAQSFHGSPDDPDYLSKHPHGKRRGAKFTNAEHMDAMGAYTGVAYQDINNMLRHGTSPKRGSRSEAWDRVDKLLDMIGVQDPTTSETTVYRGTNQHLNLSPGDEFHDEGFVSTSGREDLSRDFAEDGSMFTIRVPPGTRMADAAQGGSVAPDEEEFILPPGTRFKVTSVRPGTDGGPTEYELEVVSA